MAGGMDSKIQRAWRRAGLKLAIGSIGIATALGIRIVVATPADPADVPVAEAPVAEAPVADASVPEAPSRAGPGGATGGQTVQESLTGSAPRSREGDRIVACRLQGVAQYMRADDCELRGGSILETGD